MSDDNGSAQTEMSPEAAGSIDQIREILFGQQSRDVDTRIQDIHDRISEAIGGLRAMLSERTDAIHQKLEHEVRVLHESIENQQRTLDERISHVDGRLNDSTNDLRQQVGALSETMNAAERNIRGDMEKGLGELREHLVAQLEQVRDQFNNQVNQVSTASVSRRAFSDALRDLSSRFAEE